MNSRIFRDAAFLSVLPLGGIILILIFKHDAAAMNLILLAVSLLQLPVILSLKKSLKSFIKPDTELLSRMGIQYIPIAFQPGRYAVDSRVSSIAIWVGILGPLFTRLAVQFPREHCVTVLNFATYTAPSMNLMAVSILCLFISFAAFPFWFASSQAAAIYAEGSERKRYIMMGFADSIQKPSGVRAFIKARKK